MGSSYPSFWDKQSSSRKEISRLLEIKSKTIAFFMRWSFYLESDENMDRISDCRQYLADFVHSAVDWPGSENHYSWKATLVRKAINFSYWLTHLDPLSTGTAYLV